MLSGGGCPAAETRLVFQSAHIYLTSPPPPPRPAENASESTFRFEVDCWIYGLRTRIILCEWRSNHQTQLDPLTRVTG
jgi:hypothetical protein